MIMHHLMRDLGLMRTIARVIRALLDVQQVGYHQNR